MIWFMSFAAASISAPDWLAPAVAVMVLGLGLLVWGYRGALLRPWEKVLFGSVKLLGILALAACLVEPLWTGQRVKPGANFFVVLADNSQGMCIKDADAELSRHEIMSALLQPERGRWQESLDEFFQVRRYQFDARLQPTKDFADLRFDGRSSSLSGALRTVADRFKGQPLAGVLLLTDGNATDIGRFDAAGLPPIFPVMIGGEGPSHDIALGEVAITQTAFEDAPVTVQAEVGTSGFEGDVVAQLLEVSAGTPPAGEEKVVSEQRQRIGSREKSTFRFQVRPERSGISFYRVRAFARGAGEEFKDPKTTREATLANNARVVAVDRSGGPYRILYVSGRPNWEFKFLRRALEEDKELELAGLIRIARREPKFEFRGRAGESSNPLFRGFDKKDEDTERYDQPVLVRLNTRDEDELRGGFPKIPEELFGYHAVVVDDLEAQFFTADQLALLQRFVSERGGGFLMLGGQESFQKGKYQRTPVGDMLPVYLDQMVDDQNVGGLRLNLTREGWLQPWARLRTVEAEERRRLAELPEFEVINRLRGVKPGATVVGTVGEGPNQHPALVVQRFGHGRTAALTVGDLWRSGLQNEEMQRDLGKQWRQMIRWLVADVPGKVELQPTPASEEGGAATTLHVRARDKQFQPLNNATVLVTVQTVGGPRNANGTNVVRLLAEPSATEAGAYEATYLARDSGAFLAEAVVTDEAGAEIGRASTAWSADLAAQEFRSLKPNRSFLEQLARTTGGHLVEPNELEKFAKALPHKKVPVMETWTNPMWHRASVFAFALLCFAAEWGLRRWRGLA